MGRPRKPTKVLELNGAFRKNPARARAREDEPRPTSPIGDPPAEFLNELSPTAKQHLELWYRFTSQAPEGLLTGCDRFLVMNACMLQAQINRAGGSVPTAMHNAMKCYLAEMGMTPAGRVNKHVSGKGDPEKEDASEWEQLAQESRGPRFN